MTQGAQLLTPQYDTGTGRLFIGDGDDFADLLNPVESSKSRTITEMPSMNTLNPFLQASRRATQREFSKLPLIQAPVWQATTVYVSTLGPKVVRHSNGQLMICVAGGTSGGSEPTFNAAQPMTDGTVTWWALGRESKINSDGYPVPTITVSTTITGLTAKPFWSNQGMFYGPTCPNLVNGAAGNSMQGWCFNDGSTANSGIGVGLRGYLRVIEFKSDAPKLAIGSWNSAGLQAKVIVDGYTLEEDITPYASGNPCYYIIDWSSKGGRKMRHYRLEVSGVHNITGIAVDTQSVVVPAETSGTKGIWLSDSFGGTVSTYSCPVFEYLSERTMKRLGIKWTRNMHIGGTGYINTVSDTLYNAPSVLSNNLQTGWNPDIVVCAHSFNDAASSASAVAAAALTTWNTIRTQYPKATLVVIGPWNGATGPSATITDIDTALHAAFTGLADHNSVFISPSQANGGAWVTGTGKTSSLSGTGNSDFYTGADGTHPSYNGKQYHEERLAFAIDSALMAMNL